MTINKAIVKANTIAAEAREFKDNIPDLPVSEEVRGLLLKDIEQIDGLAEHLYWLLSESKLPTVKLYLTENGRRLLEGDHDNY